MRWLGYYQRARLIKERGEKCEICGFSEKPIILTPHHKIKRSEGGTHHKDNLIILCPNCHAIEHLKENKHKTIDSILETEKRIAATKRATQECKEYHKKYIKTYKRKKR